MSNNAVSPLQMLDWRVADFKLTNNLLVPSEDIPHQWTLNAHIDHLDTIDNHLRAAIIVRFAFLAEQDNSRIQFEGTAAAYFVFDKEKVPSEDSEKIFADLLHLTAMTNMLGNLRVFLLQAGVLFQTGAKRVMLPFINLNEFDFDKDYSYTI